MTAISMAKANEILRDGSVRGKLLTDKQTRFMHAAAAGKLRKAAKGAVPLDLNTDEANMILVGDGGSDPAAEEYVLAPAGAELIIAPKLTPDEEPTMENAMRAIAATKLKRAASGALTQTLYKGPEGASTRAPDHVKVLPKVASATTVAPAPAPAPNTGTGTVPAPAPYVPPAAPYDPGVGLEPTANTADMPAVIAATVPKTQLDQFAQGARMILGAEFGAIKDKLHRAASGGLLGPGYNTSDPYGIGSYGASNSADQGMTEYEKAQLDLANRQMSSASSLQQQQLAAQRAYQQSQLDFNRQQLAAQQGYWNSQGQNQRYATDVQRAIAQMNIDAQRQAAAQQLAYNRERLALDRMLGERQAAADELRAKTDKERALAEAQQLLMTRAGRQMVAPGGNTIPSLQPLLGRSIN